MIGKDIIKLLGTSRLAFVGFIIILAAIIFVGIGAVLDFRDWRNRPPRVKKKK